MQLSSFRLHLCTQGQAVTLISFNKQKVKKRNMAIHYYDGTLRLLIVLKYCLRNPLQFHTNLCIWEFCQFRNHGFHLPPLSPKEILEDWNGSSSNVFIIRWTPCTKTVTWHLGKTCVKSQALEWLIFEVYKLGNQQYSNYYHLQNFLCSDNSINYFLWKAESAAWSKIFLFSRTASSQFLP